MNDLRLQTLTHWVKSVLKTDFTITPIVGDASFRRYFRLTFDDKTLIAVDAPPDKETSYPFIAVGRSFAAIDVNVPQIFSFDLDQGFLLLSDFGDDLYQHQLNANNADHLYGKSLEELIKIQACQSITGWPLPHFDQNFISQELINFRIWFLEQHLELTLTKPLEKMIDQLFDGLIASAVNQPQCCIHRDYHSRNLMVLPDKVGVLDFQDAAWGPITYDAVSLLRDCYITWPRQDVERWALSFWDNIREKNSLDASDELFLRWFDWMGIQRHLKAIFIFARKYHRDDVADYLQYIPNGLQYVIDVSQQYPELQFFHAWMRNEILPRFELTQSQIEA